MGGTAEWYAFMYIMWFIWNISKYVGDVTHFIALVIITFLMKFMKC